MSESPTIKQRRKGRSGMQAMLIPSQQMVAEQIRSAPQGVHTDLGALRRRLAAQYGADACCPVTVQRHLRAVAELSFGALAAGEPVSAVTPYWRLVDPASLLAARLAGGPAFIRERLEAERPKSSRGSLSGWCGGALAAAEYLPVAAAVRSM